MPTATWLHRLAPGAAATIAIGTCATWGGVPSAEGNPTGVDERHGFSGQGLPQRVRPAGHQHSRAARPVGDNFTETVFAILLFLQGLGPLPAFDELGRPAWLFGETVHQGCTRAGYLRGGHLRQQYGDPECLVEIGCWGPVVNCNIVQRGAHQSHGRLHEGRRRLHRLHDARLPRQVRPVLQDSAGRDRLDRLSRRASARSSAGCGGSSNREGNREQRWDVLNEVPSGWAHVQAQTVMDRTIKFFYERVAADGLEEAGPAAGRRATDSGAWTGPAIRGEYLDDSATLGAQGRES